MANGLRPFALPRPDALSHLPPAVPVCSLVSAYTMRRCMVSDDTSVASGPGPIGVGRCGFSGANFAVTEFHEVRASKESRFL